MPPPTLSPSDQQALQREDARYLLLPLDTRSGPRSMAAHLRQAIRQLRPPRHPERSAPADQSKPVLSDAAGGAEGDAPSPSTAKAVARLLALQELTTPHHPAIVCKKGCSLCCSQNVTITAPEAFYLAATIRQLDSPHPEERAERASKDPALTAAVLAADDRLRGLTPAERLGSVQCPLLVDHACGVYAQRPMACRAFVSVKYEACVDTFTHGRPNEIPMPVAHTNTLYAVRMLLIAALRHEGLDDATYELTPAVATALRDPTAEARWLAGEPVFAAIQANPPIPPGADAQIRAMVDHVRGTV